MLRPMDNWFLSAYRQVGGNMARTCVYNATNFRLGELSLGYTFEICLVLLNICHLSLVARNLCFLYKRCPG